MPGIAEDDFAALQQNRMIEGRVSGESGFHRQRAKCRADVIESGSGKAHTIKTHHNVGGLPEYMKLKLVEPLRYLFKDEVRKVGEELGIPADMVWRQRQDSFHGRGGLCGHHGSGRRGQGAR